MSIQIKKAVVYYDNENSYVTQVYVFPGPIDVPYLTGKMSVLMPLPGAIAEPASQIDIPLFNGNGYGKMIIEVGPRGLLYLQLRKEYCLEKILLEPDDVIVDIYHNDQGLVYSFYNPTRRNAITVSAQRGEDIEGVYRKISSDPDNLHWRQYFVRRSLEKPDTGILVTPTRQYPEHMNAAEVAEYLNVEEKTIRNWTNDGKIPNVKLGSLVRYKKSEIDDAVAKGKIGKSSTKKKSA